ncbi:hypothetical protein KGY73_11480 [bacterium]|nr:hypothetical protein [bacterium]
MYEINRSLLIVRAKEPFLRWLNSLPDPGKCTLERVNYDQSAYLLPEYEDDRDTEKLLRKYFKQIFEEQLNGWWTDPEAWPSKRGLKTFKQWFDVEFHSMVFDLVNERILSVD